MSLSTLACLISFFYGLTIRIVKEQYGIGMYNADTKEIFVQEGACLSVLLHEAGHALNDREGWDFGCDEFLAWDTAKSIAVELGIPWLEEYWAKEEAALGAYGFYFLLDQWVGEKWRFERWAPISNPY